MDCLKQEGIPVLGIEFRPFHSSSYLDEDDLPGVGVGLQERDLSPMLFG